MFNQIILPIILAIVIPSLIIALTWLRKPVKDAPAPVKAKFWKRRLFWAMVAFYASFAVIATYQILFTPITTSGQKIAIGVTYGVPFLLCLLCIRVYNSAQVGLIIILNLDICGLERGIWILPMFLPYSKVIIFSSDIRQVKKSDIDGDKRDKPVELETREKLSDVLTGQGFEHGSMLERMVEILTDPMFTYIFEDGQSLFKNFGSKFKEGGQKGVAREVANQGYTEQVSIMTSIYAQKTSTDVFQKKDEIDAEILERMRRWGSPKGVQIIGATSGENDYTEKTKATLDRVQEAYQDYLVRLTGAHADAEMFKIMTAAMKERAQELNIENDPQGHMAFVLELEKTADIIKGSTNFNFTDSSSNPLAAPALLGKISKAIQASKQGGTE